MTWQTRSERPYLHENSGHHIVQLADELEHRIVREMLQGELALAGVARVRLAKHRVAVPGHQGLTLVHFSAQLERLLCDKGCVPGLLRGYFE
jgi:hypothetical protein